MTYFSITSKILLEEAKKLGFETEILNPNKNFFIIKWNWKEVIFKSNDFWWNSSLWYKLADDKELTNIILEKNWYKIPKSFYLNKKDLEIFKIENTNLRYPLVTKPIGEWHGNWVTVNIENEDELKKWLDYAFNFWDRIIIQEHILWYDHRVLVVWDKVVYCIKKIPAFVLWNWKNTIKELIEIENQNPLRWTWYEKPLSFIEIDDRLINYIKKSNYNLDSILKIDEHVRLRWVSNIWAWWILINVTDEMSEDLKQNCINIAKTMWLVVAWIDIMTTDLSKSLEETWWAITELGATPWFGWDFELTWISPWIELLKYVFDIK